MIVDRYYYNQLNKHEKKIYEALYKGLQDYKEQIFVRVSTKLTNKMVYRVFCAVTEDNPLIYYLNQSLINMAQDSFGNLIIYPQYFFSEETIHKYNKKIQYTVNSLAARLKLTEGSDLDKVRKVHDYMCSTIKYDIEGADKNKPAKVIMSHNIIGVFAHHKAQCEGISKAVKVLLNAVDVRCLVVSGKATTDDGITEEHSWNIVNINDTPAHIDVTWDIGASQKGAIAYDYYNVTDEQITKSHTAEWKMPACSSEKYSYFINNKLIFRSKSSLKEYITNGIEAGGRDFYFQLGGNLKQNVINEIIDLGGLMLRDNGQKGTCSQIINNEMKTCRIRFY